ncbi:acyltransferase [Pseudodesulfovibrio methanolicus]|uniref:Acyltransferase n=1 Tax=Pseudodesulfovibrio methanolicus TaxID=3126690 RepID=A0ABZ2ITL5_9BACT
MPNQLRTLLFYLLYPLISWLPAHGPINRVRGKLVAPFLGACGKRFVLGQSVRIYKPQRIVIGDDVTINSGTYLIGSTATIFIGDGTHIAPRCFLETMNHVFDNPDMPIRMQGSESADITIGKECWLAYGVVVLPGATIGDGAVVGARAVVTKDLAPLSVNVGTPAKKLRMRGTGA